MSVLNFFTVSIFNYSELHVDDIENNKSVKLKFNVLIMKQVMWMSMYQL